MGSNGFLTIGKIVGSHGVKGNLKVHSYAESLSVFEPGASILVINAKGIKKTFEINWAKPHGRGVLLSLRGIDSRKSAEALIGSELVITRESLPELENGVYYWSDIIGLSVFTIDEQYLGRVESIIQTGSNDVYVVKDLSKDHNIETLIPALESVVIEIDLENNTMRVDLPEEL